MLKIKATLRVFSTAYTLSEITKVLGEPARGFSAGDNYGKSNNKREATLWSKKTSLSEADTLEDHIKEAVSFFRLNSKGLSAIKEKCDIDLFCMLSTDNGQGGVSLHPSILGELHSFGVGLAFDIYSDE